MPRRRADSHPDAGHGLSGRSRMDELSIRGDLHVRSQEQRIVEWRLVACRSQPRPKPSLRTGRRAELEEPGGAEEVDALEPWKRAVMPEGRGEASGGTGNDPASPILDACRVPVPGSEATSTLVK